MDNFETLFCYQSDCLKHRTDHCSFQQLLVLFSDPVSCINHMLTISCDVVLLLTLLLIYIISKVPSKNADLQARYSRFSSLQVSSAVLHGCLGLVYMGLSTCVLVQNLSNNQSVVPIHRWVLFIFRGFTCFFVGLTLSLGTKYISRTFSRFLSVLNSLFSGSFCVSALFFSVLNREITVELALDVVSFLGAILLLLCIYMGDTCSESTLYDALNDEANSRENNDEHAAKVTPFAKAGMLSKMSFWWLNPLMKLGKEKTLDDLDMPEIRSSDTAEFCYLQFNDQFIKHLNEESPLESSLMWTIFECYRKEVFISGIFAFVSILALSTGPLLLNAFIRVAEGEEVIKYEGYVLAMSLFAMKIVESISQRQWYFRNRLIGLKVRSLIIALIYQKQQRLSTVDKLNHSGGEIMNYVSVDAYRIGEFFFWLHHTWATSLQICIGIVILIYSVRLATFASLAVIVLTVLLNIPLAKLLHKFQSNLMVAQDARLKVYSEALVNMKVLKFYSWETHFKNVIQELRKLEYKWLFAVQLVKSVYRVLYWTSPILVSAATFGACYFLSVPLHASNVFTFVATLRLVQDPITDLSDVIGVVIQAGVAFKRIVRFLEVPKLQIDDIRKKTDLNSINHAILMKSVNLSWEIMDSLKPTLRNISLHVNPGEKIAICGEVSSGKSTLLAAVLGEVPYMQGTVEVYGNIAYVSQSAWIQTGTIRENILFGSDIHEARYQETIRRCSLVKDLELLPYGDLTEIGERGVNLSGGQKQRVQLARALYRDADIYLLDDPFSAVDAHTATSLFNEYVLEALSEKTVLLVTHQVDFLPAFQKCLLMSEGKILRAGPYNELISSSTEFLDLVNAHKLTAGTERLPGVGNSCASDKYTANEMKETSVEKRIDAYKGDQLIKQEEKGVGDFGLKPYLVYLNQNKGCVYFFIAVVTHVIFVLGQVAQNSWLASHVDDPHISKPNLIVVYLIIGFCAGFFVIIRSVGMLALTMASSKSLFSQLMNSLFLSPMSFYDSTPLGRILSRVSLDLSIVDLDIASAFLFTFSPIINALTNLGILATITWETMFVSIPVIYMAIRLQRYYLATAKELMRLNGTTKSLIANHLAESVAGATTIRAFEEQERFFNKNLNLLDTNTSPCFHTFAANEWLIQRLETLNAVILSFAALCLVLLPPQTCSAGFMGMALAYCLSLNNSMVCWIQSQCTLANYIVSVERLNQYIHIPSEAPLVIADSRPPGNWPSSGKVEICDLQIRYRTEAPLVLRGISCTFEGGDKIGIVGRTGSGKTTLIGALFRLVEPAGGKIIIDDINICSIGLHDLRSRFGIIPQDPTLFNGTVRFNLDPLSQHTDAEIWEVLRKCQLKGSVQEKHKGLDSMVAEDGSNWSMGQRQLFCLGRALLRRSKLLVLDEATASVDNATDTILQKTIRTEFSDCTVITVAHRIPTVMDCTMVLAISEGKLMEYDKPMNLMTKEGSLFRQLVNEYWSHPSVCRVALNMNFR